MLVFLWPALAQAESTAAVADRFPELASSYAVLVDGRLLWARDIDVERAPASLVKLLTALELLSTDWRADASVKVSAGAAGVAGVRAGLRASEILRADDLLTAMLVRSANDACVALAEHAAGSLAAFAVRLNRRAVSLGMAHSFFVHPCGLDAPGQKTTVRDLVLLGVAATRNRDIVSRAGLRSASIATAAGRRVDLQSTNLLLDMDLGVIGLKTGYTRRAGDCLIALAERGNRRVMTIVLNSTNRWWGVSSAIELAFLQAR